MLASASRSRATASLSEVPANDVAVIGSDVTSEAVKRPCSIADLPVRCFLEIEMDPAFGLERWLVGRRPA